LPVGFEGLEEVSSKTFPVFAQGPLSPNKRTIVLLPECAESRHLRGSRNYFIPDLLPLGAHTAAHSGT
jgi:hypothetical protein